MEVEIIHDRLPLEPLTPAVFDRFMEKGWRILGYSILRHNAIFYENDVALTIPVRIRLAGFSFSKSQRKLLKTGKTQFRIIVQEIKVTEEKNQIFLRHCSRFRSGNNYTTLETFITHQSAQVPVPGFEIEVYDGERLVACSYFHLGDRGFCGTYCFFEPEYARYSPGNLTMLLELEIAQKIGKEYYYSGYVHHTPSQFDYKLNFNNLEEMDWKTGLWSHRERKTPG